MQINPTDTNQNEFNLLLTTLKEIDAQKIKTTVMPHGFEHPLLAPEHQNKKHRSHVDKSLCCLLDLDITRDEFLQKKLDKLKALFDKEIFVQRIEFFVFTKKGNFYSSEEYKFKKIDIGYGLEKINSNDDQLLPPFYTNFFDEKTSRVFAAISFDIPLFVYTTAEYIFKDHKYTFKVPNKVSWEENHFHEDSLSRYKGVLYAFFLKTLIKDPRFGIQAAENLDNLIQIEFRFSKISGYSLFSLNDADVKINNPQAEKESIRYYIFRTDITLPSFFTRNTGFLLNLFSYGCEIKDNNLIFNFDKKTAMHKSSTTIKEEEEFLRRLNIVSMPSFLVFGSNTFEKTENYFLEEHLPKWLKILERFGKTWSEHQKYIYAVLYANKYFLPYVQRFNYPQCFNNTEVYSVAESWLALSGANFQEIFGVKPPFNIIKGFLKIDAEIYIKEKSIYSKSRFEKLPKFGLTPETTYNYRSLLQRGLLFIQPDIYTPVEIDRYGEYASKKYCVLIDDTGTKTAGRQQANAIVVLLEKKYSDFLFIKPKNKFDLALIKRFFNGRPATFLISEFKEYIRDLKKAKQKQAQKKEKKSFSILKVPDERTHTSYFSYRTVDFQPITDNLDSYLFIEYSQNKKMATIMGKKVHIHKNSGQEFQVNLWCDILKTVWGKNLIFTSSSNIKFLQKNHNIQLFDDFIQSPEFIENTEFAKWYQVVNSSSERDKIKFLLRYVFNVIKGPMFYLDTSFPGRFLKKNLRVYEERLLFYFLNKLEDSPRSIFNFVIFLMHNKFSASPSAHLKMITHIINLNSMSSLEKRILTPLIEKTPDVLNFEKLDKIYDILFSNKYNRFFTNFEAFFLSPDFTSYSLEIQNMLERSKHLNLDKEEVSREIVKITENAMRRVDQIVQILNS